ncbi:hypothetical protein PILCRDRAFT_76421 [Piloderma croceum F 1598]|uniref:Uncharacterized protein n=1 Tax=Piloderma croceum (strain F 1598) TaxID=765440 RepID=A0A0C3AUY6_PILCF|nr:hypothetical protein PILCRDRAFT_76421 [Piloderma croceum F 1598]
MLETQLSRVLMPAPESLAHRARMAGLISPLKRVRPRVPFYDLAAHRIPTLWTLYRGLLREAPGTNIRFRVRMLFQQNRHSTSPATTRQELIKGHKWLDIFVKAREGNKKLRAILLRYDRMVAAKREKETWKHIFRKEMAWQERMRTRPILTGGYLRPSLFNRALPRLKPQPAHISMMIYKRRLGRERRSRRVTRISEWRKDLRGEAGFESALSKVTQWDGMCVYPHLEEWMEPFTQQVRGYVETLKQDKKRLFSSFSPEMLEAIKQARRDKILNQTRQLERERRGEILPRTIRRRNKAPPAHILAKMTEKQKKMDKLARHVSEVGYVGMAKRKLGHKLRNPEAWTCEVGRPEDKERLDRMAEAIRLENERRRQSAGEID